MKKKIVGIIVCTLLIVATVIPVAGNIKKGSASPLMLINTYINSISQYNVPTSTLTITATGPSDLNSVTLYYRWSSDNISWTGIHSYSIFEGFESGTQNTSLWNKYQYGSGTPPGIPRIQWNYGVSHSGSYSCAMDDADNSVYNSALNVIYTNFDFTDAENINIDFWEREWYDESNEAPQSWTGWGTYDVVAYTNDGNTWYKIVSESQLSKLTFTNFLYNISAHPEFLSPPNSDFAIAFQQFDNQYLPNDGRAWDDITISYTTGAPSKDWSFWPDNTNPDMSYPWSWYFDFPDGIGYYEFYSIGEKTGEPDETPPLVADARCRYNHMPEIFDENPTNGSTNVPIIPQLDISISDADGETMTLNWYSNSSGSWKAFGNNINVEDGTYSKTNSNFSHYGTTYWWYVTVTDYIYTKYSPIFHFTTEPNLPPYTPSNPNPSDGAIGVPVDKILKWTGGDPNSGDTVTYDVYFGASSPPPLIAPGITQPAYDPGTMNLGTKYYWQIKSKDSNGLTSTGPIWSFTTAEETNEPPTAPNIYGPPSGPPGKVLYWAFTSTDPEGQQVKYIIDWGDGNTFETNYYPEGKAAEASHTFQELGDYTIKIKAEDIKGVQSDESTFKITIRKAKTVNYLLLQRLFEQFPLLKILLNLIRLR